MSDTMVDIFKSDHVKLSVSKFGQLTDAQECTNVQKYTWETSNRLTFEVLTLDAAIVGLRIPDRDYIPAEVVLASGSLAEYLHYDEQNLTSSVQSAALRRHRTWSQRIWSPYVNGCDLILTKVLLDECRNIMIRVRFGVAFNNVVRISYQVVSDRLQSLETTHRLVMNLGGKLGGYLGTYDHVVQLNGKGFHHIDKNRIKDSAVKEMADDLADLRVAQHIGMAIYKSGKEGFNGVYQLAGMKEDRQFDSRIIQAKTGRVVEVYSDFKWVRFSTLDDLPDPADSITPFYASLGVKHIGQIFDLDRLIHEVVRHVEGDDEEVSQLSLRSSGTVNEADIRVLIDDLLLRDIEEKIRALKEEGILTVEEARGIIENLLLMSLDRFYGSIKDSESIIEACVQGVINDLVDETVPQPSIAGISRNISESSSFVAQDRISTETSNFEECEERRIFHEYQKHSGIVLQLSATPFYQRCKPRGVYSQPNHTRREQGLVYNHSVLLKFGICRGPSDNDSVNKSDSSI